MKRVEAIIKPHALERVRVALADLGITGMTIMEVRGHGRQKGHTELYRGAEYTVDFLPKVRLETVVPDDQEEAAINAISEAADSGKIGDGKIFVTDISKVVRIRTRELDEKAL